MSNLGTKSRIPEPPQPKGRGADILSWARDTWNWLKAHKVVAGEGLKGRMTGNGFVLSTDEATTFHPFQITAEFDAPAAPTVCLVAIHPGTLQGTLATGSTYAGVPLFEGSGGAPLDDDPAPDFDVGVTARTNYFYFVVTTDEFGLVDTVWIEHFIAADLPLVETPYVQPDFPSPGDPGNAGVYYWLLGSVTISGTDPNKAISISQGVETSLGFFTCGTGGRFYRA